VIFFMENHTLDNVASEVSGVGGDRALAIAQDEVIHDPPHLTSNKSLCHHLRFDSSMTRQADLVGLAR